MNIKKSIFILLTILSSTYAMSQDRNLEILNEAIDGRALESITELNLYSKGLTALPAEIGQLTNLTTLWLSKNNLTALPAEIGKLSNLTTLVLDGNDLTEIPAEIGQLSNLTTLGLSGNENLDEASVKKIQEMLPDCEIWR